MATRLRIAVLFVIAGCLLPGAPRALGQQGVPADYPKRPIRIVVPFTPGGQPDIFTRLIIPGLAESFKQQVIADNRPGAGGSIGSKIVAEAAPDGYTLLSVSSGHTINPFVYKLPYDTLKDFAGITRTYSAPFLLVAPMSLGVRSVKDLIELAKARPGQLNFASAGNGSGTHFAGEMLKLSAAIDVVHVPYRGITESLTDITAGRVQFFMAPMGSAAQLVRDGRIRGLGVSSLKRVSALADIPTIAESGLPGFEWDAWGSIYLPGEDTARDRQPVESGNPPCGERSRHPEAPARDRHGGEPDEPRGSRRPREAADGRRREAREGGRAEAGVVVLWHEFTDNKLLPFRGRLGWGGVK
jgi:tripartite-type tricarboxylate transporter receptor subunit TctC